MTEFFGADEDMLLDLLRQQREIAQRPAYDHSTAGGALLGGIGDILRQRNSAQAQQGLMGKLQALRAQRTQAQQAQAQAEAARKREVEDREYGLKQGDLSLRQQREQREGREFAARLKALRDAAKAPAAAPAAPSGPPPLTVAQMESQVQDLGKDMETPARMAADVETLERAARMKDVPGFGPLDGRIPDMMAGDEALGVRQAAKRIMAAIVKEQSGTAASENEVERLLASQGLGQTATDDAFKLGVPKLKAQWERLILNREAKYRPEARAEYAARRGFTSAAAGIPPAPPDGQPPLAPLPTAGAAPSKPPVRERIAALKAQGLKGEDLKAAIAAEYSDAEIMGGR